MQLEKGTRLGPYEIVAPLGSGGMGEVYRARDTRLGREVAVKILPRELSADPKLRIRFEREAKAISSLSHPNICALHDVGEVVRGNTRIQYIVMEYLEGKTLEASLTSGPLPIDQVVERGIEIADALDKAHRKQILHRDLKPSNIMMTKSGARLFDFGLAKFVRDETPSESGEMSSQSLTDESTAEKSLTAEGRVIGTLEYMAPEQLRGNEPDARTDIFSFGVCLYQMITGKRPFQGNTRASVANAILEQEPQRLSVDRPETPPALEWLVKNCLAKDPDERIQTAHDVKLELTRIANEIRSPSAAQRIARSSSRRWVYGSAAAATLITIIGIIMIRQQIRSVSKSPVRRLSITLPANAPIADIPFEQIAASPDGSRLAYVSGDEAKRLYLYSIDTREARPLPGTEGAMGPFFSPDGQWIGFFTAEQGLKRVPVAGGPPVLVSAERDLRGATWGPHDTIVFAQFAPPMWRVAAAGGRPEALQIATATIPASMRWPMFLPDGNSILFTATDVSSDWENSRLMVESLKNGKTKTVLTGATYGRYTNGHLFYLHLQTLFAAPFDPDTMLVTGPAASVATDIASYSPSGLAHFAVSSDGSVFYIPRDASEADRQLLWVDRAGRKTAITSAHRAYDEPRISPDGQRILVRIGPIPRADLWLYDIRNDSLTRLTTVARNESAVWSPDGSQIAFASTRAGGFSLYVMPSDGSAAPKRLATSRRWDFPTSWSPDGKAIAFVERHRETLNDIYTIAPRSDAAATPLIATAADEWEPAISPNGHWIAYRSNESGRDEIYVQSYPHGGQKRQLSNSGGTHPVWRKNGTELFYRNGDKMMAIAVRLGPEFTAEKPRLLFEGDFEDEYDVTADGQKFIMVERPPQSPRTQINVILGFLGGKR